MSRPTTSTLPRGAAFATGLSLLTCDWIEVEIVGVPFVADHGSPVIKVWVPSMEEQYAYTNADLRMLSPKTKLARELIKLKPVRQ